MKIILTYIQPILILVLLILLCFLWLRKQEPTEEQILLKQEREALLKIIQRKDVLIKRSEIREKAFREQYEAADKARLEASQLTDKWRKRYEIEKNSRPVAYSDHQLDSILTAWYGR